MGNTALITGASSGIGKEFARIHAATGGDLVIVARSADKLDGLKQELEQAHNVKVTSISKDLGQPNAAGEIYAAVKAANLQIDILINNAGFGGRGKFHERDWADDLAMINLNITALTRLFLPDFVARNSGRILNVSSTASLLPGPLQAVYYATKAYVTSFSNAIAEELHDTDITVTALLPGATESDFAKVSGMDKTSLFNKTASAREVAQAGYDAMLAGRLDVIAGMPFGQRLQLAMIPFAPKKMLLKQIREMQEVG
ncbi:MAG: SDR family NAD(P)-dependent oxidoreductase [Nevskiales bacterium]